MTVQNLLQQCRKKFHSKVLRFWVALAAAALLLVLACRGYDWDALGRYKGDNISSLHYVRGRVLEVLRDDTLPDQLTPPAAWAPRNCASCCWKVPTRAPK